MAEGLMDIGTAPMSEDERLKQLLAIAAPRALGPIAGLPTPGATPPFLSAASAPHVPNLGLGGSPASAAPPPAAPAPVTQPKAPLIANQAPAGGPGLGLAPSGPDLPSDVLAGRVSPPTQAPEPHANIFKRGLGTLLEMSTNPNMSKMGRDWLHPEAAKFGLEQAQYTGALGEADKRADIGYKQAQTTALGDKPDPQTTLADFEGATAKGLGEKTGDPLGAIRSVEQAAQKPAEPKSAKEQIQAQISAELAKPQPDQNVVKGLQDRLQAIDPQTKENKPVAGTIAGSPTWGLQTDTGWVDPQTKKSLPNFKPPLNYAQVAPDIRTVNVIDPNTQLPTTESMRRFNEGGGTAISGSGTYAHQMEQSAASQRMIDTVVGHLRTAPVGNVQAWAKSYLLGTPIADPQLAGIEAELMSTAALQPAIHQFRAVTAMQAFDNIVGGLAKNPAATIKSLEALRETAQAVNPTLQNAPGGAPAPKVGDVVKGYRFKGGDPSQQSNWDKVTR